MPQKRVSDQAEVDCGVATPVDDSYRTVNDPEKLVRSEPSTSLIGEYEILEEIARGGMGVVYKGRHRKLGRVAAVKLILKGELASDQDVQRFESEATAAAQLEHPGIVPIYEVGQHDGQHFMALAYVDGQSLWSRVKQAPLEPREAARMMELVSLAVHHAHQKRIIHRDLKPQNILLTNDGQPRVTDFGLAKSQDADSSLTAAGQVLGTPSYMPPEQALGRIAEVGPLADVYSLGATLYCLLTGKPPFQAANVLDTLRQVLETAPLSPRVVNPAVDRDLETICLKCLQKESRQRYQSAADLAADLGRFRRNEPIVARSAGVTERSWRWCRRNPITAGFVLSLTVLLIVIMIGAGYRSRWIVVAASLESANSSRRISEYHAHTNAVRELAANPVLGWTWKAKEKLHQAALNRPEDVAASELGTLATEVLSRPDARNVAHLAEGIDPGSLAFSPDGSRLAIAQRKSAVACAVMVYSTSDKKLISTRNYSSVAISAANLLLKFKKNYQDGIDVLSWSPDSRWLAAGTRSGNLVRWDMTQKQAEGVVWAAHQGRITDLEFTADGKSLFSCHQELKRWQTTGKWSEISIVPNPIEYISIAPNGRWMATTSIGDQHPQLLETATLNPNPSWPELESAKSFAFSPDGRFFVVVNENKVVVHEAHGGEVLIQWKLEENSIPLSISQFAFTADGTIIVGLNSSQHRLHFWELTTGREIMPSVPVSSSGPVFAISSQGGWIAMSSGTKDRATDLFEWHQPTSCFVLSQAGIVRSLDVSPNGKSIALALNTELSIRGQQWSQLLEWDMSRRQMAKVTRVTYPDIQKAEAVSSVAWNPDGDSIAWFTERCGILNSPAAGSGSASDFFHHPGAEMPVDVSPAEFVRSEHSQGGSVLPDSPSQGKERVAAVLQGSSSPDNPILAMPVRELPNKGGQKGWNIVASVKVPSDHSDIASFQFGEFNEKRSYESRTFAIEIPDHETHWYLLKDHWKYDRENLTRIFLKPHVDASSNLTLVLDRLTLVPMAGEYKQLDVCRYGPFTWSPDGLRLWGLVPSRRRLAAWKREDLTVAANWENLASNIMTGDSITPALAVGHTKVLCGGRNGFLTILPAVDGELQPSEVFRGPGGEITAVAWGPDEHWACVATRTGRIEIREIPGGRILCETAGLNCSVESLSIAMDGRLLAAGCDDGMIRLFDVTEPHQMKLQLMIRIPAGVISQVRLESKGRWLFAIAKGSRQVVVWNLAELSTQMATLFGAVQE